jgi:hypothetical protein
MSGEFLSVTHRSGRQVSHCAAGSALIQLPQWPTALSRRTLAAISICAVKISFAGRRKGRFRRPARPEYRPNRCFLPRGRMRDGNIMLADGGRWD